MPEAGDTFVQFESILFALVSVLRLAVIPVVASIDFTIKSLLDVFISVVPLFESNHSFSNSNILKNTVEYPKGGYHFIRFKFHFITIKSKRINVLFLSLAVVMFIFNIVFHKLKSMSYLLLILSTSCVEPYHPRLNNDDVDIMVINGFINASKNSAVVSLSHANALSNPNNSNPERDATVVISEEDGTSFTLEEKEPGSYVGNGLLIKSDAKYQLTVTTTDGDEYASDYTEINATPPIDSISWEPDEDGITIFANTHDFTNKARHYKWSFTETWEYRSVFSSEFKLVNDNQPLKRQNDEQIDLCYRTIPSTKIYIGTTERLTQNIISNYILLSIPKGDVKLSQRYSLIVTQSALRKEEYSYLQQLQRTTESFGSIFDPQPSPVIGNIHHVKDASIPVIGYFSGGTVHEQRIFIRFKDLPIDLRVLPLVGNCNILDTVCVKKPAPPGIFCNEDLDHLINNPVLVGAIYDDKFRIVAYTKTSTDCGDCRSHGGTLERPDFW